MHTIVNPTKENEELQYQNQLKMQQAQLAQQKQEEIFKDELKQEIQQQKIKQIKNQQRQTSKSPNCQQMEPLSNSLK